MTEPEALGTVIAERTFGLVDGSRQEPSVVRLHIGLPKRTTDSDCPYVCPVTIEGLFEVPFFINGPGVDAIAALACALNLAASMLYLSRASREGRLTFRGSSDFKLPLVGPIGATLRELYGLDKRPDR